jgi:hypothetical protein
LGLWEGRVGVWRSWFTPITGFGELGQRCRSRKGAILGCVSWYDEFGVGTCCLLLRGLIGMHYVATADKAELAAALQVSQSTGCLWGRAGDEGGGPVSALLIGCVTSARCVRHDRKAKVTLLLSRLCLSSSPPPPTPLSPTRKNSVLEH